MGATMRQVLYAQAELARHDGATGLASAMHQYLTLMQGFRRRKGAPDAEGVLRRVAAEGIVIATSGGSDWLWPTTTAVAVDGGFRVSGRKTFCSQSPAATVVATSAVLGDEVLHFSAPTTLGRKLAVLGRELPVVFDQRMGAPLVLRHKDVSAALRDTGTFGTQFYGMGPMAASMIAHDGAEHTRQRRIHNRFFSPGVSRRYAERIVPIAVRTFGSLKGDRAELVEDAIARYPMQVFLDLLGIPDEVGDQGLAWVRTIVSWLGSPMEEALAAPGMQAYQELSDYTRTLVEAELTDPKDNLLGEIIRAHLDEDQFSLEACVVAVVGLILGGFETTIQMVTATISSLLLNPDALEQVRADRSLIEPAIDEAFRWANPSAGLYRLVLKEVEIAGTPIAAGSMAYFCIAAAHYDEEAFPDPARCSTGVPGCGLILARR